MNLNSPVGETAVPFDPLRTVSDRAKVEIYSKPPRPQRAQSTSRPSGHRACSCRNCQARTPPVEWPRHYLGLKGLWAQDAEQLRRLRAEARAIWLSYECHLERQPLDPDLEDELRKLRNEPERVGSALRATADVEQAFAPQQRRLEREQYHRRQAGQSR